MMRQHVRGCRSMHHVIYVLNFCLRATTHNHELMINARLMFFQLQLTPDCDLCHLNRLNSNCLRSASLCSNNSMHWTSCEGILKMHQALIPLALSEGKALDFVIAEWAGRLNMLRTKCTNIYVSDASSKSHSLQNMYNNSIEYLKKYLFYRVAFVLQYLFLVTHDMINQNC